MSDEKNRDVLVTVSGLQLYGDETESIEVVTRGRFYKRSDKRYVFFEEEGENPWEKVKNLIEIDKGHVDVLKKGMVDTRLSFEEGQKLYSVYQTPFGRMQVGVFTEKMDLKDSPSGMDLTINYRLEINNEHMSENSIHISTQSV